MSYIQSCTVPARILLPISFLLMTIHVASIPQVSPCLSKPKSTKKFVNPSLNAASAVQKVHTCMCTMYIKFMDYSMPIYFIVYTYIISEFYMKFSKGWLRGRDSVYGFGRD